MIDHNVELFKEYSKNMSGGAIQLLEHHDFMNSFKCDDSDGIREIGRWQNQPDKEFTDDAVEGEFQSFKSATHDFSELLFGQTHYIGESYMRKVSKLGDSDWDIPKEGEDVAKNLNMKASELLESSRRFERFILRRMGISRLTIKSQISDPEVTSDQS